MIQQPRSNIRRILILAAGAAAMVTSTGPAATVTASSGHRAATGVVPSVGSTLAAPVCQSGGAYTLIRMSPHPIATFGSLKPNQSAQFFAQALNSGTCVSGTTLYLTVDTHVSGDRITVSPSQCSGVSQLSSSPTACTTDAAGKVMATYTAPGTVPPSGAVQITASHGAGTGFFDRDFYLYESIYRFSASPIAQPGSLTGGQSVNLTLSALGVAGAPQTNVSVYLSITGNGGGGSASAGGTRLSSTARAFTTDSNGQVSLTYTAPTALPSGGIDTLHASSSPGSTTAAVFNTTAYAFDRTTPVISVGDLGQTEADASPNIYGRFNVTLSRPSPNAITLFYQTDCGVGDKGCKEDYLQSLQPTPHFITIPAGQVRAQINLLMYSYVAFEPYDETMFMQLIQPSGTVLGRSLGDGTLFGDDETTTAQQLYVGDQGVVPSPSGTEFAEVTVVLANPASSPVTFTYTTRDGTALGGTDYTPVAGTASIAAGSNFTYIQVPILPSARTGSSSKSLTVTISNPSGATINRATGTVNVIYLNS